MSTSSIIAPAAESAVAVRDATPADNAALVALAAASPMRGDVGICVDRAPDFFALNRLEGDRWRVGVAEVIERGRSPDRSAPPLPRLAGGEGRGEGGAVAGCVAVAVREAYLEGRPTRTLYVGDLKVLPRYRGGAVADALTRWAREACEVAGGDAAPVLVTVLAGNHSAERRMPGPRGLPQFTRFATLCSHSIPLLRSRRSPGSELRISRAREQDIEEMAALWRRVAPTRQFAAVYDAASLHRWIDAAPGLELSDYHLARQRDGRLAGFLATWDQSSFKQLRVTGYSARLAVVRALFNAAAPLLGATPLPPTASALRCSTAVHVCVPPEATAVLRALLIAAYNGLLGRGYSFLNLGLDTCDPLETALRGLFAQPTAVHAYVTTAGGRYTGPALSGRPLHHEIALV